MDRVRKQAEKKAQRETTEKRKSLVHEAIFEYNDHAVGAARVSMETIFRDDGVFKSVWNKYKGVSATKFPTKAELVSEVARYIRGDFVSSRNKRADKAELDDDSRSRRARAPRVEPTAAAPPAVARSVVAAAAAAAAAAFVPMPIIRNYRELQGDVYDEEEATRRAIELSLRDKRPAPIEISSSDSDSDSDSDSATDKDTPPASQQQQQPAERPIVIYAAPAAAAAPLSEDSQIMVPDEETECAFCLEKVGGKIPLLGDGSGCTHMICDACLNHMVDVFAKDPNDKAMLECQACKNAGKVLHRPYTYADNMFIVHPRTFAFAVPRETKQKIIDTKKEYIARFTVPLRADLETSVICQMCDSRLFARGPCSIERPCLAVCKVCFSVSCTLCGECADHSQYDCPMAMKFPLPPFNPHAGRLCPRMTCKNTVPILHIRGDGCHLMRCRDCGKSFCYACGKGSLGDIHQISRKQCTCPLFCGDGCPCLTEQEIDAAATAASRV